MSLTDSGATLTDIHRRAQVRLAITADSQARRLWDATLDINDLDGTQPIWKRTMIRLLRTWYGISADEALDYLPQFRRVEIGSSDLLSVSAPKFNVRRVGSQLEDYGSIAVKARIKHGSMSTEAYAAARDIFLGAFHQAVLSGGRKTVEHWADLDSRATGYRRVSDGNPCAFCAMLVSRGPAYTSEAKALAKNGEKESYHPHCGCTVEVIYGDWTPTKQEQQYVDAYYAAAESLPKGEPRTAPEILQIMRRDGSFTDSPTHG